MRVAVVIGSTGLVGHILVNKLGQDRNWSEILVITRKKAVWSSPKVRRLLFNFEDWGDLELQIKSFAGSNPIDFFCCLGTTISQAGSEQNFRKVDFEFVYKFSQLAKRCSSSSLVIISALGADPNSPVFYNRTKGEMEEAIRQLNINKLYFLRPSLLLGDREQFRLGERILIVTAPLYKWIFKGALKRFKPVEASTVATAMIKLAKRPKDSTIIENTDIFSIAKEKI